MKQYFENQLSVLLANSEHFSKITDANLKFYPSYLYKYRTCNESFNFEMVEQEYLWADIPSNFTDPYDSLLNLKLLSELPLIKRWIFNHLGELIYYNIPPKGMRPHKKGQKLSNYIKAQEKFVDETGRYNAKKAKKAMLLEIKKFTPKQQREIEKVYAQFENKEFEMKMEEALKTTLAKVVNSLRNKNLVCCITARKDNLKMWEDYADKYSGFVIEYDIAKAAKNSACSSILAKTFPVTYYKRIPKVPLLPFIKKDFEREIYGKDIEIHEAETKLFKQLLVKKFDYRVEEEWRIISLTNKISFPCISAIYAGQKIAEDNLQKLKSICEKKDIRLYKQEINLFNGTLDFHIIV